MAAEGKGKDKDMALKMIYSPPVLDWIDEIKDWLHEIEIWQCVTDIEEKKQGPVVYLSLPDKIRKSCNDISVTDLNKDNGLYTYYENKDFIC